MSGKIKTIISKQKYYIDFLFYFFFADSICILRTSSRSKRILSQSLILERKYGIMLEDFVNQSDLSRLSTLDKKIDHFITRF